MVALQRVFWLVLLLALLVSQGLCKKISEKLIIINHSICDITKGLCDYNLKALSGIWRATHLISTFAFSGSVFTATQLQTEKFYC